MKFPKHLNYLYILLLIPIIIGTVICLKRENKLLNFINKPTPTPTANAYQIKCNRTEPPKIDPKMQESIKLWEDTLKKFGDDLSWSNYDCINVEYKKDIRGEGSGEFDPAYGKKIKDFNVYVSDDFKDDPRITSVILMHEFTHLEQFINRLKSGNKIDCILSEVEAYHNEISYILKLDDKDSKLIDQRVVIMKNSKKLKERIFAEDWQNFTDKLNQSSDYCYKKGYKNGQDIYNKCVWEVIDLTLKKGIESTPEYQERCKESLI